MDYLQVEQIKDVLDWLRSYHQQVANCYERSAEVSESARLRRLLSYLADHEHSLADSVANYEKIADSGVLNTWCYEFMARKPNLAETLCQAPVDIDRLSVDQLIEMSLNLHEQLIEFYRYLLSRAGSERVKELFQSLIELEQSESWQLLQETEG
ncbi:ATPase [Marinobacterium arenosum]|uniref:ATPase n=1 Tax=Marinobacterium arenosum TaxID=2862496 RepID=UPI001C98E153|nr:ATPase [Marinobacterium arenosum]MBY4678585.1 ATPase [Marinobacterium arenosum]